MAVTGAAVSIAARPVTQLRMAAFWGLYLLAIVLFCLWEPSWLLALLGATATLNLFSSLWQARDLGRRALRLDGDGISWPYGGSRRWTEVDQIRIEPRHERPRWLRRLSGYRFVVATPGEVDFARRLGRRPTGYSVPLRMLRTTPDRLAAAVRACSGRQVTVTRLAPRTRSGQC